MTDDLPLPINPPTSARATLNDHTSTVTSHFKMKRPQCSTLDYLGRITEAWTQNTTTCATVPAGDKVGGPAPYWQSFAYDKAGNRTTETQHSTTGDATKDTKRTYAYPTPGKPQAHSLSSVVTSSNAGTKTDSYAYDAAGNTTTRPGQRLTWDAEGHLATVAEGSRTTEYLYDADGNRLIGRTPTETTLYLGHTEVTLAQGATKPKATRYTDLGGGQMAVRSDDGTYAFTIADHHGTGQLAIQASDLALTQRKSLPFGGIRGEAPKAWPGTKGFVGGTDDTKNTGLTHLGAREYDPSIGRFISVDPILDLTDPQQINGYTYSNNGPFSKSDPTGELMEFYTPDGDRIGAVSGSNGGSFIRDPNFGKPKKKYVPAKPRYRASSNKHGSVAAKKPVNRDFKCNRFKCTSEVIDKPIGDDADMWAGVLTGVVDTATSVCGIFKIFGDVECASDAIRQEFADSGIDTTSSAFGDAAQFSGVVSGATAAPLGPGAGAARALPLLARRTTGNVGEFSGLAIPMQKRAVRQYAEKGGVGLSGVRVRIDRNPELIGKDLYGHTAPNRTLTLYPDAFSSPENLVKTIGHERQHVMQIDLYGPRAADIHGRAFENAAYAVEGQYWNHFNGGLG